MIHAPLGSLNSVGGVATEINSINYVSPRSCLTCWHCTLSFKGNTNCFWLVETLLGAIKFHPSSRECMLLCPLPSGLDGAFMLGMQKCPWGGGYSDHGTYMCVWWKPVFFLAWMRAAILGPMLRSAGQINLGFGGGFAMKAPNTYWPLDDICYRIHDFGNEKNKHWWKPYSVSYIGRVQDWCWCP